MVRAAITDSSGRHQSCWVGAYCLSSAEARAHQATASLIQLEQRFQERLWRLEGAERRLSAGIRLKRGDSGRRTIRHIERERQRLGRELHTEVAQMLAAIRIQLELIDDQLPSRPPPVADALEKISSLAHEALEQVRNISRRIHPPEWQRLRLDVALRQFWELTGVDRRFVTSADIQALPADPEVEIKSLIFRAAQEGIANVMRHAHARRVDLTLSFRDNTLSLRMRDDGVGFDSTRLLAEPASVAAGIGLRSIREEAAELNGKLLITSSPLGTTLEISVPWTVRSP